MANKPTKPINHAKVITPEQIRQQKENQALAMLVQKREQFALAILANSVRGEAFLNAEEGVKIVNTAVAMADHLLEKLYPVTKEEKK